MNRRNILKTVIASAFVPGIAGAAKSADAIQREALRAMLELSDEDQFEVTLLRIAMREGHYCRAYALELCDAGIPISEVYTLVTARIDHTLYGPEGAPVYDDRGRKIGGGSLRRFRNS